MATISSANVTVTINYKRRDGNSKVHNNVTLAFGNGTLQYPTGGFALPGGNIGCPNNIESVDVVDVTSGSGYIFYYNLTTSKLQIYTSGSHNHTLFIGSSSGTAGTTAVNATTAAGLFESGGTQSVAGIAAASGTIGGIVTAQPAASLTEVANNTAIAACTVVCEVIGW